MSIPRGCGFIPGDNGPTLVVGRQFLGSMDLGRPSDDGVAVLCHSPWALWKSARSLPNACALLFSWSVREQDAWGLQWE